MKIQEGLQRHDLNDLVLPFLDIDTFESKIDDARVVVVAFYVLDQDPADDLNRFIERSNVPTLDIETSPAPTEDGYYVVFVEMDRNRDLPEMLMQLMGQIENLTNVSKWQFKTFNDRNLYDLSEENLREHVNLDPDLVPEEPDEKEQDGHEGAHKGDIAETAALLLRNGLMESIAVQAETILLTDGSNTMRLRARSWHREEPSVPILAPQIGDPYLRESMRLGHMLGSGYSVDVIQDGFLVGATNGWLVLELVD